MQANEDNQDEDDAIEGLAQLEQQNPYAGAPIHREEQFRDSNLVNNATFDESSLWKPFQTCSDAYATLELESFVKKKVHGTFQFSRGGNMCRVVCRGDVDRIKWNKVVKKYQPISNDRNAHICSYRAHIRKIRPKEMTIIIGSSIQSTRSLNTTTGVFWVPRTVLVTLRFERNS